MATNTKEKGRKFTSSTLTAATGSKHNRSKLLPKNVEVVLYEPPKPKASDLEDDELPESTPQKKTTLRVKNLDFNVMVNTTNHRTDQYEITEASKQDDVEIQGELVVRRSQEFTVTMTFDRAYNPGNDKLRISLEIGEKPVISKGTLVQLIPDKALRPRHWSASIQSLNDNKLTVAILTPPTCYVGKWVVAVETWIEDGLTNGGRKQISKYVHPNPVYMIFNPLCKDDSVYMEDAVQLDEYIFNETGKMYSGNHRQLTYKPWVYGQFEKPVLECCMLLLEKSRLNAQSLGNPVAVTRAISAIVNSEDNRVLVGNWSGNYDDGTSPSHWTGSVPILKKYHETNEPVGYGQCLAFSGVSTTVCRALGIPARSVTNFSSSHDCDGNVTMDSHWDEKGNPISSINEDFVWNFHVWNEVWMARTDLEFGYGGWQAFDSCPQQTSRGLSCAGPASVRAIREGNINLPHDGAFIFAEVNADRIHWILKENGQWDKVIDKHAVGKKISTKRPRGQEAENDPMFNLTFKDDEDRLDITETYKYKEGTESERAAVYKANQFSTQPDVYDRKEEDVKFELNQKDDILVGNSFDVVLRIRNKSREKRTVHLQISLETVHYTGCHVNTIKSQCFDVDLHAIKTEEAVMRVQAEEYLHCIVDQVSFKVNILAMVKETKQIHADHDDFRLRRPDLEIETTGKSVVGKPLNVLIKFQNSMPVHLTNCEWMVEAPGLQKSATCSHRNLEPYDRAEHKLTIIPQKAGVRQLVASFTSKELMDVTGLLTLNVQEAAKLQN